MNKTKKRQLNLKNKLIAAIAMLLVSSIMMVSTTYAWFTLSTAPEVQGITTTVGANGNLEIALSPTDGDYNKITSNVGDANEDDWTKKNLTWGNLLDLSDSYYRLNELTLLPSQLNINAGSATAPATLADNPLKIPVYGADGRISALDGSKVFLGGYQTIGDASGFMAGNDIFGVRAMGTSSAMSPNAIAFNNAISAMTAANTAANNIVTAALNTYGAALADMAVKHASGQDDNYVSFVPNLKALSAEMVKASDEVEKSLYNALLALAKSKAANTMGLPADLYSTIKAAMDEGLDLSAVWGELDPTVISAMGANETSKVLLTAYEKWEETAEAVTTNKTNVDALPTTGTVEWTQISSAMSGLMNINNIKISGYALDDVMENIVEIMGSGGVTLQLNAGSGVIANFGELTGNILSAVKLSEGLEYTAGDNTIKLGGLNVNIETTTEPTKGALILQTKAVVTLVGVYEEEDAEKASVIDVIYGYAVDFVFRTNAANSSLLLQTDAAQRIYDGSNNAATLGNGSTITFSGKTNTFNSLVSMMSGIRVVFKDTKGNEVYGIAKVNFNETEFTVNVMPVTRTIEEVPGVDGAASTFVETFTPGAAAPQTMKLTVISGDVAGSDEIILTTDGLQPHQYIVWENVTDPETNVTHVEATIKTALWANVETQTVTTPVNADGTQGNPVTTNTTTAVEIVDAKGNPIFYEEKDYVDEDDQKQEMTAEQFTAWVTSKIPAAGLEVNLTETLENGSTVVVTGSMSQEDAIAVVEANYVKPVYQQIADQDVTLEGPLALYEYKVAANGALTFLEPKTVQALTTLDQNVATGVSALVYLDGDYVDNGDVTNSEDGISNTGSLNLQFASSANLVPMQDTSLLNGIGVKLPKVDGVKFDGEATTTVNTDYSFSWTPDPEATTVYTLSIKSTLADGSVTLVPIGTTEAAGSYTIPAAQMQNNIEIVAEPLVVANP